MLKKSIHSVALNGLTYHDIFVDGNKIVNGDFSDGDNNWNTSFINLEVVDGVAIITDNDSGVIAERLLQGSSGDITVIGDKYYTTFDYKVNDHTLYNEIYYFNSPSARTSIGNSDWNVFTDYFTADEQGTIVIEIRPNNADNSNGIAYIRNIYTINLTELFGSGNEPTQEQMDALFAEFQEAGAVAVGQFEQGQGKNLFDKETTTTGYDISESTGNLYVNASRETSDYIAVAPNTTYHYSHLIRLVYFDSNKTFISGVQAGTTNVTLTTPTNTAFLRFSINSVDRDSTQLEQGSVATDYEPYKYLSLHLPATNDVPITSANNKTLNEIFDEGNLVVNGDFSDGTTGWQGSRSTLTNDNGTLNVFHSDTSVSYFIAYNNTPDILTNDVMYLRWDLTDHNVMDYYQIQVRRYNNSYYYLNSYYPTYSTNYSELFTLDGGLNYLQWVGRDNDLSGEAYYNIDNIQLINLTDLGIDNLTQAEMDALYERYTRNKERTLLANTLIQHDQNSVPIADLNGLTLDEVFDRRILTDVTELPNGVKYYEIDNGNIVQKVKEYELQASDINILDTLTNVQRIRVFKPTDYILYNSTPSTLGTYYTKNFIEDNFTVSDNTANIDKYSNAVSAVWTMFIVPLGTYANLSAAQADFAGTKILYQLTTPITIVSSVSITQEQLDYWFNVWQQNHKLGMRVHRASGNDVPIYTRNLFNKDTAIVGYYIASSGSVLQSSILNQEFYDPTYHPINTGEQITVSQANAGYVRVAWYDSDQTFIGRNLGTSVTTYTVTAPANAKFFRISNDTVNLDSTQVEYGSTATDYITHSYTLNEVFRDGQLVTNGETDTNLLLSDDSGTGIALQYSEYWSIRNPNYNVFFQTFTFDNSNDYYFNVKLTANSSGQIRNQLGLYYSNGTNEILGNTSDVNMYSMVFNPTNSLNATLHLFEGTAGYIAKDYAYLINLTDLGIDSLTQSQLDYLFTVWQFNNANAVVARQFIQNGIGDIAYGGLTYKEIFEDGNLILQDYSQFSNYQSSDTVSNGVVTITATGNDPSLYVVTSSLGVSATDTLYGVSKMRALSGTSLLGLRVGSTVKSQNPTALDTWYTISHIGVNSTFEFKYSGSTVSGNQYQATKTFLINLTDLFGAGNEPNQATMDTLYQEYITLKGGLS